MISRLLPASEYSGIRTLVRMPCQRVSGFQTTFGDGCLYSGLTLNQYGVASP
ncbi:hypothetical protein HMPREF9418_1990 [Neisseria macacae ATCC 33926]|uniref:Uncharacterized protein n=1 Tax=Neisseria macacae ATCC 33926 TaxID=997348 RepID=A0AA36XKU0_9NEIS|nr:hypothetical protein HMPREF9418_1990 [Neisseria macacae ATCC 33926]